MRAFRGSLVFVTISTLWLVVASARQSDARTFRCEAGDTDCLIAAMIQANGNGRATNTIRLAPGTYEVRRIDNHKDGPNGLPSVTSTMTIEVDGEGTATLTGAADTGLRLLHVSPAGNLTLRNVVVSHGSLQGGTSLPLDCLNLGVNDGGGLFNHGGVVTLVNATFIENIANAGGALANLNGLVAVRGSTFSQNVGVLGGAICSSGPFTLDRSVIDDNTAVLVGGMVSSGGNLQISKSVLSRNKGDLRSIGGLFLTSGTAAISETTFVSNFTQGSGGGMVTAAGTGVTVRDSAFIGNGSIEGTGAISNGGTLQIVNTTIANNNSGFQIGAAISNSGTLVLVNTTIRNSGMVSNGRSQLQSRSGATTIVQNSVFTGDPSIHTAPDCEGVVVSRGNNIFNDLTGCTVAIQPSDKITDARLETTLADDGEPGHQHLELERMSPAIDAGNNAVCTPKDQIGRTRRGPCDIGAIEYRKRPE
jgi:hypothetical protein